MLHGSFPADTMEVQALKACSACSPHPISGVHSCLEWSPPRCLSNACAVCAVHVEYVLIRLCTTAVCACLRHLAKWSQFTMSSSHGKSPASHSSGNKPRTAFSIVSCGQKQSDVGEHGMATAAAGRFATAANAVAGCVSFVLFALCLPCPLHLVCLHHRVRRGSTGLWLASSRCTQRPRIPRHGKVCQVCNRR